MTDSVSDEVTVKADAATVLAVVRDVEAYPQWQAETKQAKVLARRDDGLPARVRFVVDAGVFRTTAVLDYQHTATGMSWTLVEGEGLRRNDGSYQVTDRGDGTTRLAYALSVEPTVPIPGIIRRRAAKRIVDTALRGAKTRAETLR
jgi:ribosome-associated toxin RatA of RatAB toxin-antitoxin module